MNNNQRLSTGWSSEKLENLGFLGRGKSKHRPRNDPSLYGGKYPFIQTGEVKEADLYITKYQQTYSEKGLAQSKLWKSGTLLLTIAANVAETAILKIDACFPDSIVGFIPDPKLADVRFIKYYIDTIKLQMQSISRGTTQDNLSLEKIRSFDFNIPPLLTQRKIAGILSAYDDLIENNTRRIEILEEMARMLYREWFVKFRFPVDGGNGGGDRHSNNHPVELVESELGLIPKGWKVGKVAEFGKVITGKTPSKKKPEYYGDFMPFIKTPSMHGQMFCLEVEEYLSQAGVQSQRNKILPPDTLIVNCIGALAGSVSITSEYSQTNQQINAVVLNKLKDREFLYFSLVEAKERLIQLGATGATMINVSKGKFENLGIITPNALLLEKFHKSIASKFNLIKNLQQKNINLRKTRDLLLPRLISGEIDVEELDINLGAMND